MPRTKEEMAEYNRLYYERNKERLKEKKIAYDKARYAANLEKMKADFQKWKDNNREKTRATNNRYYIKNRDEILEKKRLREARSREIEKGVKDGTLTDSDVFLMAAASKMQECTRLRVKALRLPCGEREECFLNPRCERCPRGSVFSGNFKQ